jgi:site-specific DNA recombinase
LRPRPERAKFYRSKIERLAEALNAPDTVTETAEILRRLVDRIVLTPVDDVLRAELHGDLAVLARFAQAGERRENGAGAGGNPAILSVVAGVGFEPTTFRL